MEVPLEGSMQPTPCAPGFHQPAEAQADCVECRAGQFQPKLGEAECRRCDIGQDSISAAAACTICAKDYFRPHSDAECVRCDSATIKGVTCGRNATTETLNVTESFWRLSEQSTKTYSCHSIDGWTPCRGGTHAGNLGDGYCAVGHVGPMCEGGLQQ
eukprot:4238517-Prymnesium_polylepis.1